MALHEGVLLAFFDLPMESKKDQQGYRKWRKVLEEEGFQRIQKSVYLKYIRHYRMYPYLMKRLFKGVKEINGTIYLLLLSKGQFEKMVSLIGGLPQLPTQSVHWI